MSLSMEACGGDMRARWRASVLAFELNVVTWVVLTALVVVAVVVIDRTWNDDQRTPRGEHRAPRNKQ